MAEPQQVLARLNFGKVDGETDNRFEQCFIGTEMLRQTLLPQHSLVVGNKGSGKSAMCRLLSNDLSKVRPLLPKQFEKIYAIPAYGLQSEEALPSIEFRELRPESTDEFRYHWLLYIGLKLSLTIVNDPEMNLMISRSQNPAAKEAWMTLRGVLADAGLRRESPLELLRRRASELIRGRMPHSAMKGSAQTDGFQQRTGMSILAMLDAVDTVLQETRSLVWVLLDKLDLLYVDDIVKLRDSITGLVQLLVQYGSQWKNIHLKIFLRNDIYRQLHIVNKSHLISYSTEMKWRGPLLLKLLVARAVVDPSVREYCQERLGEEVDITNVILGTDEFVLKVFNTIFEPMPSNSGSTHQWILNRLIDGMGNSYPREIIHLGNRAVERQRELDRQSGEERTGWLISTRALRDAFDSISAYRCDTYLYSEFPHLAKHFDVFRGNEGAVVTREELYERFGKLEPSGDEAIRAVFDVGLLTPLGTNIDSSRKFKIPLLYRSGLGVRDRRPKKPAAPAEEVHPLLLIQR